MTEYMKKFGLQILQNGYTVLPIIPGEKRPALKDWRQRKITDADVRGWQTNGFGNYGIGIRTGQVVLIDIDTPTEQISDELEMEFQMLYGPAPTRYGNWPKCGMLFRVCDSFTRLSTREWYPPGCERVTRHRHAVEVLADGQQFVAYAIHPETGKRYFWVDEALSPLTVPAWELPELTIEQARDMIARAENRFAYHGLIPLGRKAEAPIADDDLDAGGEPLSDLTIAKLTAMLELIPNDDVPYEVPNELCWLHMLMAIAHQTRKSADGQHLAYEWSVKSSKHSDAEFDKTWASLETLRKGRPITARYIVQWAKHFEERQKPEILVRSGYLHEAATEAESALIESHTPVYSRGVNLVTPVIEEADATEKRKTKIVRLVALSPPGLIDYLSQAAIWKRFDKRSKKTVRIDPPVPVAAIVLSRDGKWRVPRLKGVITTQTMRSDGSLLKQPGFDPTTRLLLESPPSLPPIPERPTRADASRALDLLVQLLAEFPFVNGASHSVGLSMLMTPVLRGAIGVAPMHVAHAPTAGTGKTYLIDVASAISTGRLCPVVAAGKSAEETDKRVGAALLTGQPLIAIDNVNGVLEGDTLCQAISQTMVQVRILGTMQLPTIETQATIFATGNNIIIAEDLVRRTIRADLDANMERPENRRFRADPVDAVLANRGRYIAAILTIVRAYLAAGSPSRLTPLVGFNEWSRLVRAPLVWLGHADPIETQQVAREDDPRTQQLRSVVRPWRDAIGIRFEHAVTVGEIIARANDAFNDDDPATRLREALLTVAGTQRDGINAVALGRWLGRRRGNVIDSLKIESFRDGHNDQLKWYLSPIDDL
jgi:putative DNA primase/helicase